MRDNDTSDGTIFPDDEEEEEEDLGTTRMSPESLFGPDSDDLGRTVMSEGPHPEDSRDESEADLGPTLASPPREAGRKPRPGDTVILRARRTVEELGFIVVWSGPRRGDIFTLDTPRNLIGHDRDADIFVDDNAVSGRHATIRCEMGEGNRGQFVLRDLDSENGTEVNGKRIDEATVLQDDDVITVGQTELVFKHVRSRPPSTTG